MLFFLTALLTYSIMLLLFPSNTDSRKEDNSCFVEKKYVCSTCSIKYSTQRLTVRIFWHMSMKCIQYLCWDDVENAIYLASFNYGYFNKRSKGVKDGPLWSLEWWCLLNQPRRALGGGMALTCPCLRCGTSEREKCLGRYTNGPVRGHESQGRRRARAGN